MKNQKTKMFLIKLPYWLGIGADALWAIGFLFPSVFAILSGNPDFAPEPETMKISRITGTIMLGWTFLLLWAVRKPIERRGVIFLTAFPVVFGLFMVELIGYLNGNTFPIWILIKLIILFVTMMTSYILAGKEKLTLA